MTKEQNVLIKTSPEIIYLQVSEDKEHFNEPFPHGEENITWCADSVLDCEIKYIRADFADALTKPLEEKINHWVIMTNTYADNLELHKAKIAELEARIAEQQKELDARQAKIDSLMLEYCHDEMSESQIDNWATYQEPVSIKELDDCKDAVVMLYEASEIGFDYCKQHWDMDSTPLNKIESALLATSAIVEGYKK